MQDQNADPETWTSGGWSLCLRLLGRGIMRDYELCGNAQFELWENNVPYTRLKLHIQILIARKYAKRESSLHCMLWTVKHGFNLSTI